MRLSRFAGARADTGLAYESVAAVAERAVRLAEVVAALAAAADLGLGLSPTRMAPRAAAGSSEPGFGPCACAGMLSHRCPDPCFATSARLKAPKSVAGTGLAVALHPRR